MNAIVSRTSRIDGRGGNTNSFCAWYSFRMSFCSVPPSAARGTPAASAWATYMAKITAAGELIVIDVVTVAQVDAAVEVLHVGQGVDGHAAPADLALGHRVVGVEPHQRGHVEGGRQPVAAGAG